MKYYLLTFNDNYADAHNIPALQCFNEEDYNKWLGEKAGRLNPKYEEQLAIYEANEKINTDFWKNLKNLGITNLGKVKPGSEADILTQKYRTEYKYSIYAPSKVFSYMSANLGNGGDCFEDGYTWAEYNRDFIEMKGTLPYVYATVKVAEVDKSFYNIFHKNRLNSLSLCNIFEFNKDKYIDDEEEEDE